MEALLLEASQESPVRRTVEGWGARLAGAVVSGGGLGLGCWGRCAGIRSGLDTCSAWFTKPPANLYRPRLPP